MSETLIGQIILALIAGLTAGIPACILAIATLRTAQANGSNSKSRSEKTQQMVNMVDSKTDALRTTAIEIKSLTNGNLARISFSLDELKKEIELLKKEVGQISVKAGHK